MFRELGGNNLSCPPIGIKINLIDEFIRVELGCWEDV